MADPPAPCDHPDVAGRAPLRSLVPLGLLATAIVVVALLSSRSGEGPSLGPDDPVEGSPSSSRATQGPASLGLRRPLGAPEGHDPGAGPDSPEGRASRPEAGVGEPRLVVWVRERPGVLAVPGARCRFEPTREASTASTIAESVGVSSTFEVVTDAEGRAELPDPATPGAWVVEAEGFVTVRQPSEAGAKHTTVWVQRGRRVEGVVLDADRRPVPGARVSWSAAGQADPTWWTQAGTGPDGRFRIDPPTDVDVRVTAWARHSAPARETLSAGTEQRELALRLSRAMDLLLVVRAADATPLVDVRWRVDEPLRVETAGPRPDSGPIPLQIRGLQAIPFELAVSAPGFRGGRRQLSPPTSVDDPIQTVEVVLEPDPLLGRMRLRLVSPTGSPRTWVGDEHVHVERLDGRARGAFGTKANGDALDIVGLAPGPYAATTWLPDFAPARVAFDVEAGITTEARAVPSDEARLRLRVTGVAGRRVLVRLLSGTSTAYPTVLEDPRGQAKPQAVSLSGVPSLVFLVGEEGVLFGGLPAGPLRIEAVSPDVTATPVEVALRAGHVTDAEVSASVR